MALRLFLLAIVYMPTLPGVSQKEWLHIKNGAVPQHPQEVHRFRYALSMVDEVQETLTPAIAKAQQEFEDTKAQWAYEKTQLEKEVELLHKTQHDHSESLRDRDREMCAPMHCFSYIGFAKCLSRSCVASRPTNPQVFLAVLLY
jgi:hypothetical protein